MKKIWRTLLCKAVIFRTRNPATFVATPLDRLLVQLRTATRIAGERHWPRPTEAQDGDHCLYIDRIRTRQRGDGTMFTVGSYTKGLVPEQMLPDFNRPEVDVLTEQITDAQGRRREVVQTYRCVAYGGSLLIESVKGGGGAALLATGLTSILQQHVDQRLPRIELLDVASQDLASVIAHGGGLKQMFAQIVGRSRRRGIFSRTMSVAKRLVPKTARATIVWDAGEDGGLDADAALRAVREWRHESALDAVVLKLRDGQTIDRAGRYHERRSIELTLPDSGRVPVAQVEDALWNYIDELRIPNRQTGWRMLNNDGTFAAGVILRPGDG